MTQWHSKELGNGVDALAPTNEIQQAFIPLYAMKGQPVDMAIFTRYDLERNIVTVYFSPAAEELAKTYNAAPCEKPKRENRLALIVGNPECWNALYPNS